jgi:hypothetical protein
MKYLLLIYMDEMLQRGNQIIQSPLFQGELGVSL